MIAVEGVTKRYGSLVAVDRLSFRVDRGEVVGFLGPNGAGKSTTMKMLTGTLQPDEGQVLFEDRPIAENLVAAKRRVGYLPEANPLYDEMLVVEYLEYVAQLRDIGGSEARSAVADAVDETDISSVFYRPVGECSKGFRQRIGLAAAILHKPEVLILDEPTEGLDPNQRVEIRRLVGDLGKERTVLLSTHVMQEVEATCSRLIILRKGKLAAEGDVQEILTARSGASRYVVEAEGESVAEALAGLRGVASHTAEPVNGRLRVSLQARGEDELRPEIFRMAASRGWTLWELHRERATLEQIFRDLTTEAADDDAVEAPGEAEEAERVAVEDEEGAR
jgi:gliding motility-associated transport system ATP-binding protein